MTLACAALLLAVASGSVPAQDRIVEVRFHRVHLRNGNFVDGSLLGESDRDIVLQLRVGEITIRRDQVVRVEFIKIRAREEAPEERTRKPAKKPAAPEKVAPQERPTTPASDPRVPEEVRGRVDAAIALWKSTRYREKDLAADLEAIGRTAVPYLAALIDRNHDPAIVEPVCAALGRLRDARALPALANLLSSDVRKERESAVKALVALNLKECEAPLVAALGDDTGGVWRPASEALVRMKREGTIPDPSEKLMAKALKAESPFPYAMTLGELGSTQAHEGLRRLADSREENLVFAALQALRVLGDPADGALVQSSLQVQSAKVIKLAALFLGELKFRPAVPDLINLLGADDASVTADVHWALKQITGQTFSADPSLWKRWWESEGSK